MSGRNAGAPFPLSDKVWRAPIELGSVETASTCFWRMAIEILGTDRETQVTQDLFRVRRMQVRQSLSVPRETTWD